MLTFNIHVCVHISTMSVHVCYTCQGQIRLIPILKLAIKPRSLISISQRLATSHAVTLPGLTLNVQTLYL